MPLKISLYLPHIFGVCSPSSRMASDSVGQTPGSNIMIFHPTKEEFKDFSRYVAYMESQGAHRAGMAKVIPPKDWKARRTYDDIDDLVIPAPIQQVVTGESGLFTQYNIQKKPMSVREFRRTANTDKFCNPRYVEFEELERKYWRNLTFNPPLYGADINGTLYDPDVSEWNMGHLNTILDLVEKDSGIKVKGVITPFLYFGMWKSTFAWHTEDMDLYSVNYLHFGEPKSWYVVPPEHGKRLERLAKGFFPGSAQSCEAFLRHKMTLISPSILRKYGIPLEKVTQEAGEFIVTFPFAYHAGFNHGFNCAESTNFATQRWIDYGKQAALCSCRKDMVKISMDVFVRKFQPERYKLWKAGKDNAPIDHSKVTLEVAELLTDEKVQAEERGELSNWTETISQAEEGSERPAEQGGGERAAEREGGERAVTETEKTDNETGETQMITANADRGETPTEKTESGERETENTECEDRETENTSESSEGRTEKEDKGSREVEEDSGRAEKDTADKDTTDKDTTDKDTTDKDTTDKDTAEKDTTDKDTTDKDTALIDEEGLEGESWAKRLALLWQNRPYNEEREREYNREMGLQSPYCAVCMLFQAHQRSEGGDREPAPIQAGGQVRTKPLIPEVCFTTTTEDSAELHLSTPHLEQDGTSVLISCAQCCVRVHTSCYGVAPERVTKDWRCARCVANALTEVSVHWPDFRRSRYGVWWVHVLCAVAILEARFVNVTERSPIDLSGIPLQRFRLKCYYCKRRMKRTWGCCVQCSHGRCPTSYHPTCAQVAGVLMHPDDWPFVVYVTCCRHKGPSHVSVCESMRDLSVGQKVICKHKNGRYYQCDVVQLSKETFYEVNFDDGSFSDNLFPEDIVGRDCSQLGPPPPGDVVQVRWTDGLIYGAKFVASHVIQMYQVEFEDGSQLTAKRDDVYTLDEELPKRVKSRLVSRRHLFSLQFLVNCTWKALSTGVCINLINNFLSTFQYIFNAALIYFPRVQGAIPARVFQNRGTTVVLLTRMRLSDGIFTVIESYPCIPDYCRLFGT
uniref:[histone H3]-trimethyl-L-lysine(9) demethylase n=1 Tax=Electrophorus electricus TaxID=8005 RepID=A0AAY5EPQ2_ELEEL